MHSRRDDHSIPAWSEDQLDSLSPPEMEAPYFDDALKAWVLSRHADILAAFRDLSLSPASHASDRTSPPSGASVRFESDRLKMRAEAMEALCPARLRAWRGELTPQAHTLAASLPIDKPMDLMDAYARPLCLSL